MRQLDLVKAFVDGATEGDALSLHIRGDQLVHYNTAILERHEDNFILNYTRYSLATGKAQKMITDTIDRGLLTYVSGVPSDTRSTLADFLKPEDGGDETEPNRYLMEIEHGTFGHGLRHGHHAWSDRMPVWETDKDAHVSANDREWNCKHHRGLP